MVESIIRSLLQGARKKTISLSELERAVEGGTSYEEFAGVVNELVKQGILVPKSGSNHKPVALALSYRIIQSKLSADHLQEIENCHFTLHPLIKLDVYYNLPSDEWENDLPYIQHINRFLKEQGLPDDEATAPERSYALVGDEKWIDEKGGKKLLERVGIWSAMNIVYLPDPLMLAVNQLQHAQRDETGLHLVVENKATFHALLEYLPDTMFYSLIYGAGWKITA
ncbi:MAG TPA: cytosolic protein, partial [Syntrophomonas wolfei]|nr:cytosolic protein [Syntrophomonas wolfei]